MQQSNVGSQSPLISLATGGDCNFEFGFNSITFSDRVLKIVILADQVGPTSTPPQKRRREEDATNKNDKGDGPLKRNQTSCSIMRVGLVHVCSLILAAKSQFFFKLFSNGMRESSQKDVTLQITASDDGPLERNQTSCNILRVELVHVCSLILAAKSQFFFKLFTNGMKESSQKDVTLQINASEEAAFMELLRFIYGHKLSSASHPFVLDLVMIADKFEVPSCMDYYIQLAMSLPMTEESALLYLNLPLGVSIASNIQPLTNFAKEFLTNKYKGIMKFKDEVLTLPFAAIEVIFSSDNLIVPSEDDIFDLLVQWACTHYSKLEAQREFFASNLAPLIRFPQISFTRLRKFLASADEHDMIMKFVSLALLFKAQAPHSLRALAPEKWLTERDYSQIPIKMEFETPFRQCIVYLNLNKEKLAKTSPNGEICSQDFHLGGHDFFIMVQHSDSNGWPFRLYLAIRGKKTADFKVEFESFVRAKPSGVFESRRKMSWDILMADESRYFIDEVLHLKVEVAIKQE